MRGFKKYNLKTERKVYKNPFFKNSKKTLKGLGLLILPILFLGGGVWMVFDSPVMRIQDIELSGVITESEEEVLFLIKERVNNSSGLLPSYSILRRHRKTVADVIEGEFMNLELESFRIESRVIYLNILEKPYGTLIRENNVWSFISEDKERKLNEDEVEEIENRINNEFIDDDKFHPETPILELENQSQSIDNAILKEQVLSRLIVLNKYLVSYGYNPSFYRLENQNDTWVKVIGINEVPIFIELLSDHEVQINTLISYLQQYNDHESHIDIRFAPRVYVR